MRLPDPVFETLKSERARFGPVPSDVELGVLLNRVAWQHRGLGFGLSRKVGGTTVPFPGGGTICHDVLMLEDGTAWDVLEAAGDYAKPIQSDSFVITDPARGWLAPVNPGGPVLPMPEPSGPSDVDAILAALADLEARVVALENTSPAVTPFDPSQYEAAGKFGFWGVTLPLRKKA